MNLERLTATFVAEISRLVGDEFQGAVSAHLQASIDSFQPVPADGGDGGLDGLSHNGTRGYFCYGPELERLKTSHQRTDDVVTKFRKDLRKVFEVKTEGRDKLKRYENDGLRALMADGTKLSQLVMICSWKFNKNTIKGVQTARQKCEECSELRHVEKDASLIILGPNEFAALHPITELTLGRLERGRILREVEALAKITPIPKVEGLDFDEKIRILHQLKPDNAKAIERLADGLRKSWSMSLALGLRLDDVWPRGHERLERERRHLADLVAMRMLGTERQWELLGDLQAEARAKVSVALGENYADVAEDAGKGEIARLMGDCTIAWKGPTQ